MTVHNRKDITLNCLDHLFQSDLQGFDICVYLVDDGCTDGTGDAVKHLYPEVRIIKGNGNLYWNHGMLLAWKEALKSKQDFFLWLNDDTFIFPNAIKLALDSYLSVEPLSIISGSTCSEKTSVGTTFGGLKNKRILHPNGELQILDQFWGNFVLVPQCVVERIGILDSRFKHYFGDTEYSMRAGANGVSMYLAPEYVGVCEVNCSKPKCFDESYGIIERWRAMHTPLGKSLSDTFYLYSKYNGRLYASLLCLDSFLRMIFPTKWLVFKQHLKKLVN